jgi:heat shock protein HslJ
MMLGAAAGGRVGAVTVNRVRLLGVLMSVGVLAGLLAGCGSSSATPSPVGTLWAWNGLQETHPAHLSAVPDPQNYLLALNKDGTFEAKADCNQLHGSYSLSGDNLTLTPGPMTKALCPPGSLSDQYVHLLGKVTTQAIENGQLTLGLANDSGSMFFHSGS